MRCALIFLAACAQAGHAGGDSVDASSARDAARTIDAGKTLDTSSAAVCTTTSTCATATDLGSVSGDTNNDKQQTTGYQAGWYKVRVTENDNGVFGVKLQLTTALTSPASNKYDVFVYYNSGSDVVECATPSGTATTAGTTETLGIKWGEGTLSNGNDDSRTVSIEVRPNGMDCQANAPWTLMVSGDN